MKSSFIVRNTLCLWVQKMGVIRVTIIGILENIKNGAPPYFQILKIPTFEKKFAIRDWNVQNLKTWRAPFWAPFFRFTKIPIRDAFNIIRNQKSYHFDKNSYLYSKMHCPNRNFLKTDRAHRFSGLKMELESSKNQVFTIRKFTRTLRISRIAMTLIFNFFVQWKLAI